MTIKYEAEVTMPHLVAEFFERISEVGWVGEVDAPNRTVTIELQQASKDEYELAEKVFELKQTLSTIGFYDAIDISRPVLVED